MKANQSTLQTNQVSFGWIQIGILLLGLVTAIIHLVVLNVQMGGIDPLFTLNGLGYLVLLAAYFLPISALQNRRNLVRWAFIVYTALGILAWIAIGDKSWPAGALGYGTKLVELALIVLLLMDRR